jgi:uncharacterized protein (DUF1499 family)
MLKTIGWGLLILIVIAVIFIVFNLTKFAKQSREMTPQLGNTDKQFVACPGTPNCINSQSSTESEKIEAFTGGNDTFQKLAKQIAADPTATIISQTDNYLHATYQSKLFGFIDDLELYLNQEMVEVRSASRTGKSDMGANRKRVEALRVLLK